jgi:peptidoglycan/LPS O-acetylase OafA/YrhL
MLRPIFERNVAISIGVTVLAVGATLAAIPFYLQHPRGFYLFFYFALPWLFVVNRISRVDRWLGDLFYPIYLIHWPVNSALLLVMPPTFEGRGNVCFAVTLALSCLLLFLVDRPLDAFRQVRARSARYRAGAQDISTSTMGAVLQTPGAAEPPRTSGSSLP